MTEISFRKNDLKILSFSRKTLPLEFRNWFEKLEAKKRFNKTQCFVGARLSALEQIVQSLVKRIKREIIMVKINSFQLKITVNFQVANVSWAVAGGSNGIIF
jgi:hypothetical protein